MINTTIRHSNSLCDKLKIKTLSFRISLKIGKYVNRKHPAFLTLFSFVYESGFYHNWNKTFTAKVNSKFIQSAHQKINKMSFIYYKIAFDGTCRKCIIIYDTNLGYNLGKMNHFVI